MRQARHKRPGRITTRAMLIASSVTLVAVGAAGTAFGGGEPTGTVHQAGSGQAQLEFSFTNTTVRKLEVALKPTDPINGSKCNPPCTLEFSGKLKVFKPGGKASTASLKKFPFKANTVTINDESLLEATARMKLQGGKGAVKKASKLLKSSNKALKKSKLVAKMVGQGGGQSNDPPVILKARAKPTLK